MLLHFCLKKGSAVLLMPLTTNHALCVESVQYISLYYVLFTKLSHSYQVIANEYVQYG